MKAEKPISNDKDCEDERILDFVYQMARQRLRTSLSELRTIKELRSQIVRNKDNY